MNTEQEVDLAAEMIKRDAPSQGIDFEDPANAYTVWTRFPNRMQFCGNRRTLDEAYSLADDHIRLKNLYVVKGPLSALGILALRYPLGGAQKAVQCRGESAPMS